MDDFSIVTKMLEPADVPFVYPLIAHINPGIDRQRWLRFGGRLARLGHSRRRGSIVVHLGAQPMPCATAFFQHDPDMQFGRVLSAQHFVVMSLSRQDAIVQAMTDFLEKTAEDLGCGAMRCVVRIDDANASNAMETSGMVRNSIALIKQLRT